MDKPSPAVAAAKLLATAARGGGSVSLPDTLAPRDLDAGTAIQDELAKIVGGEIVGWKLALTSAGGQARNGFDRPFTGRLYKDAVRQSPAKFAPGLFRQPLLEAEIAFRMREALPVRSRPYAKDEVLDAVDSAFIGVEVADLRYAARWPVPMPLLAADNGGFGAYVVGPDIPRWRERDLSELEGSLEINGRHAADNLTGDARTDAIAALVWAVNELSRRRFGLHADHIVTTGSATVPTRCEMGTSAVARFVGVGEVRLTL